MTSWGQEAELKGRIEQRIAIGLPGLRAVMSADRHVGRPGEGEGGEQVGSALGVFLYFTPTWIIRERMEGGGLVDFV